MKNIYILKLISGIELISEVEKTDDKDLFYQTIYLTKPLRFGNAGASKTGAQQVGFFPYLVSEPEPSLLPMNGANIESYLEESQIDEPLVKEYKTRTSVIQLI